MRENRMCTRLWGVHLCRLCPPSPEAELALFQYCTGNLLFSTENLEIFFHFPWEFPLLPQDLQCESNVLPATPNGGPQTGACCFSLSGGGIASIFLTSWYRVSITEITPLRGVIAPEVCMAAGIWGISEIIWGFFAMILAGVCIFIVGVLIVNDT